MADFNRAQRLRRQILTEVHYTLGDKLFSEFMIDIMAEGLSRGYIIKNLKSSAEVWLFARHRNNNDS